MSVDFKDAPRIVDPKVLRAWRKRGLPCLSCKAPNAEPHHIVYRSHSGDDAPGNLAALCDRCHGALHGRPYMTREFGMDAVRVTPAIVRRRLAAWILSDDGQDAAWYLVAKLGTSGSVAFVERLKA